MYIMYIYIYILLNKSRIKYSKNAILKLKIFIYICNTFFKKGNGYFFKIQPVINFTIPF